MSDGNGALPEGWEVSAVEDFARTATGGTPSRKRDEYYGGDIPWVKSGDLNDGLVTAVDESITQLGLDNSNAKMFPRGAVCIALYGATVGKLGILDIDATTNQAVCGIFPNDGVDPKYVFHALRNERANLIGQAQGGAQPNISNGIVKKTQLRIAPEAEQRRIVSRIESLQERSSRARRALSEVGPLLEQFRQSVLRAAFSGRLTADWRAAHRDVEPATELLSRIRTERRHRWEQSELAKYEAKGKKPPKNWQDKYKEPEPANEAELPELPDSWCWITWNEISEWITYGFTRPMPHVDEGIPIITAKNVIDSKIDFDNIHWTPQESFDALSDKDRPVPGDILITKDGTIGRAAIVQETEPFCINQSVAVVMLRFCPIDRELLLRAIEAPFTQDAVQEKARGMAMKHLSITDFGKMAFPLPPTDEHAPLIAAIEESLASVEAMEDAVAESESALTQLDQSILAKAFRGELVPQDPRDEPASELLARIRTTREANSPAKKTRRKKSAGKRKARANG